MACRVETRNRTGGNLELNEPRRDEFLVQEELRRHPDTHPLLPPLLPGGLYYFNYAAFWITNPPTVRPDRPQYISLVLTLYIHLFCSCTRRPPFLRHGTREEEEKCILILS